MNVAVISCFRNATAYIPRYFDQVGALAKALAARGDWLSLLLGYGDSADGTGEMLFEEAQFNISAHLVDVSHGGPVFGSIEHPQRFKQLAYAGNKLLDYIPADADIVGIVESDLIWDAATIVRLIDHLQYCEAIAPMIMDGPDSFYDVWGFRRNGVRFTKTRPFHPELNGQVLKVDSAGSVLFMRGDLARLARFTDGEAIVGLCKEIYQYGGRIWLDPAATVTHPQNGRVG